MKKYKIATSFFAFIALSGCAYLNTTAKSYPAGSTGRLFVWGSDYMAGVGRDNAMCVQGALTASASSFGGAVKVLDKIKAGINGGESVTLINASNPQTAYANAAYFNICQLAANMNTPETTRTDKDGTTITISEQKLLTGAQIVEMFNKATDAASKMNATGGNATAITSPKLEEFIGKVLQASGAAGNNEADTSTGAAGGQGDNAAKEEQQGGTPAPATPETPIPKPQS